MKQLEPISSIKPISRTYGDVVIYRNKPNFDCLASSTMHLLLRREFPSNFSERDYEKSFPDVMLYICKNQEHPYEPNIYTNPSCLITAPDSDPDFIAIAKENREQWRKRTRQVLGKGYRSAKRDASPILRQLIFEGVLIHQRKHRFPNDWPKKGKETKPTKE